MKFEVVLKNLDTDRQKLITVEAESKTDAERKAGIEANKLGHVWAVNFVKSPNSRNAMDLKPVGDSARRARLHRALDAVMDKANDAGVLTDDILFDVDQYAKTSSGKRTPATIAKALKYAERKYGQDVIAALRKYYGAV